jgi:septal ring factor EnvC (AmiA/AmiB activator)
MTDEEQERKITVIEQRQATMESDIKEIKADVKEMPDLIVKKVNESTDLKLQLIKAEMENRLSETEKKYQSKLIGLLLGIIAEAVGLIISFIR